MEECGAHIIAAGEDEREKGPYGDRNGKVSLRERQSMLPSRLKTNTEKQLTPSEIEVAQKVTRECVRIQQYGSL